MKYKIGDKVKYDGGDWWLYGTVSAVFEHSICPCYRISIERMEKKSCKFSITQFEFELEAYNEEVEGDAKDKRKWENSEMEYLKKYYGVLNNEDLSKVLKRSPQNIENKWRQMKPEQEEVASLPINIQTNADEKLQILPETQDSEPKPEKKQRRKRKQELKQEAESENVESTQEPKIEKPKIKRGKRGEAWNRNLEMYRKGEKSNAISTWIAQNRREYKEGKMKEEKFEKLVEINFPFDVVKKKNDNWDQRLEEWKKGERRNKIVQQWRQRSIKQFVEGKLSVDRILKLREIGILK